MKQKNPNSNACCRCVVDDAGDARRAPEAVILALRNQFLKRFRDKNTANFHAFGASQAKNHGTLTVVVVVVGGGGGGGVVVCGLRFVVCGSCSSSSSSCCCCRCCCC